MNNKTPGPIGWLGCGLMAAPMIRRQLAAGYTVHVWNRTRAKMQPLIDAGAIAAESPAAIGTRAEWVLMCLMNADAVEQTIFGEHGLVHAAIGEAPAAKDGAGVNSQLKTRVLVDHSSIRPEATRTFAARILELTGISWIDAPVSGGVIGASNGSLAVMAGGNASALAEVDRLLRCYAGQLTHMGPAGAGQTTKLINQILVCSALTTIAESIALAQAAGIDARQLPAALAGGWADSKPLQVIGRRMIDGYQDSIGALSTLLKDLDTALDLARSVNCALPMAASAQQLLRLMSARGSGDADPAELINLYRPSLQARPGSTGD